MVWVWEHVLGMKALQAAIKVQRVTAQVIPHQNYLEIFIHWAGTVAGTVLLCSLGDIFSLC